MLVRLSRRAPETGPVQQFGYRFLQLRKRRFDGRRAYDKHQVVTGSDVVVQQPNCFAHASFGAVAVVGLADLFADNEATARVPDAVPRGVQNEQRVRPGRALATHPLKLLPSS